MNENPCRVPAPAVLIPDMERSDSRVHPHLIWSMYVCIFSIESKTTGPFGIKFDTSISEPLRMVFRGVAITLFVYNTNTHNKQKK